MDGPDPRPEPAAFVGWEPPAEFDDYVLLQPIGSGRMGVVYLAEDTVLARHVAIKFIAGRAPDVAAREQFLVEARAAARLSHPNVVTIHRVGELRERPYLVTEFVRGKTLAELDKPLPWERALGIGIELARGLAAAHRSGVLHCDIKCANAVLSDDGSAKLLDFGLATLLRQRPDGPGSTDALPGAVGKPDFMAPELFAGGAPSRKSDVYSLGAVLYELCAGRPPFADVPDDQLTSAVLSREPPPLRDKAPAVDPRFAAIVDKCLRREADARYASGDELRQALEELSRTASGAPLPKGNPYRGLRAFAQEDRALFFGRSGEISVLLDRLRTEPLVLVAGDSGAGKSSLCRAGVLPAVLEGALDPRRAWTVASLSPGARPAAALAAALAPVLGQPDAELLERLRAAPASIAADLARKLAANAGLLVFVDQLEELLALSDAGERAAFAPALAALGAGLRGVRVLGTIRADFLGRFAALRGMGDDVARALFFVRPLARVEMREVIVGPARAVGLSFESDALVEALVSAAAEAEGGLPLLQFALAELWEARDRQHERVTQAALDSLGGVAGALSRHADAVIAALPPAERAAARAIATRLVTLQGTRARRREHELLGDDPAARRALEALVRGRLVVAQDADGATAYELAHEVLLQGWAALKSWLLEDAEGRVGRERLAQAAAEWVRLQRASEALWGARQVREVEGGSWADLAAHERDFLRASRSAVRRAALKRWATALGAAALAGLVYATVTLKERHDVRVLVDESLREARSTLQRARSESVAADAARSSAFAAFDKGDRERGEAGWMRALQLAAQSERDHGRASRALEQALARDPGSAEVRALLGDELLERALELERARKTEQSEELIERLALYDDDGSRRARWLSPATLEIASDPAGADVSLQRADEPAPRALGKTPLAPLSLPRGTYLVGFQAPGRAPVRQAIALDRGSRALVNLELPAEASVPENYVYVPSGQFLFGSADDEGSRRGFFDTVPLHAVSLPGFLIARTEVTYGDYLAFLDDLPPAERARRTPSVPAKAGSCAMKLEHTLRGWRLTIQPARDEYSALAGEPIRYRGRKELAVQDWRRFPVTGVSAEDAEAYAAWLRSHGVPRARLCTEYEWERAARGADDRIYPHGNSLNPADADYDESHGKEAMGPDVVGAHPRSASVFGVQDLSGNAYEWVASSLNAGQYVARGGSFFHDAKTVEVVNRTVSVATLRDATLGMRVCAALR